MFPDPRSATVEMARAYFQSFLPATLVFHSVCRLISSAWIINYTSEVPVALENCTLIKAKIQQKFNNICKVSSVLPIESINGKYWQVTLKPSSKSILSSISTCVFVRAEKPETLSHCSVLDEQKLLHSFSIDIKKPSKLIFNGNNVTKLFTGRNRLSVKVLCQLTPTMTPQQSRAHLNNEKKKERKVKSVLLEKEQKPLTVTHSTTHATNLPKSDENKPVHKTSADLTNIYDNIDKAILLKYIREHIHLVISTLALIKAIVTKRNERSFGSISELKAELLHKMLILKSLGIYCDEVALVDLCKMFVDKNRIDKATFNLLIERESKIIANDVGRRTSTVMSQGYGTNHSIGILDLPKHEIRIG